MTPKAGSPSNTRKFASISTLWGCKIAAGCIYDVYLYLSVSIFIYNLNFLELSCFIFYVSCNLSYLICPFLFLSSLIFSRLTLPYHILAYRSLFILYHNVESYGIASHRIASYSMAWHRIISYSIIQYRIMSYRIKWCHFTVGYQLVGMSPASYVGGVYLDLSHNNPFSHLTVA